MNKEIKQVIFKLDLTDDTDKKINDFLNRPLTKKTITIKKALLAYMDIEGFQPSQKENDSTEESKKGSTSSKNDFKGFKGGFSKDF